jgi:uncharacterized protein YeeX (DUF496 family)
MTQTSQNLVDVLQSMKSMYESRISDLRRNNSNLFSDTSLWGEFRDLTGRIEIINMVVAGLFE